jgi:hypothetical protein
VALALAMLASLLVLADWSRGQTFSNDELGYASRFATQSLGHVLLYPPANKYMIAVPLLVFRALFGTVGLDSYAPYAGLGILLNLLCGGLFYLLARRRVGDLWALPPTVLLLFFGYGWGQMSTAIPSLMALASGLGMMLVLTRRDLSGDLAGAGLLTLSLFSHPEAIAFAVAAAILIASRSSPDRWRRAWVFLVPAGLYAIWWLFLRVPGQLPMRTRIGPIATFVGDALTSTVAAITGLAGILHNPSYDQAPAWIAAGAVVALAFWAVATRSRTAPPTFWATAAAFVTMLVITAFAPFRSADEPRYLYPAALLLLLTLSEVVGAAGPPNWMLWAATGILALGLVANIDRLNDVGDSGRRSATQIRANFGATEIASDVVDAGYRPLGVYYATAGEYLDAVHAFGSPAYSPSQLTQLAAPVRGAVDAVLINEMRLRLQPADAGSSAGTAPRVAAALQGRSHREAGCTALRPIGDAQAFAPSTGALPPPPGSGSAPPPALGELVLPPGGVSIRAPGGSRTALRLGRFADAPMLPLEMPQGTEEARLVIPDDASTVPWRLVVYAHAPVSVCGLA